MPAFSQFEEKFEEINGVEAPPSLPSTSGYEEHATASVETNEIRMQGQEPRGCAQTPVLLKTSSVGS